MTWWRQSEYNSPDYTALSDVVIFRQMKVGQALAPGKTGSIMQLAFAAEDRYELTFQLLLPR